ncbi:MAG: hypothetical protein Q9169_001659 [Polycauliona sp. 2 TL-2023]
MIAASFATCTAHLILTQGVLYGLGAAMLYNPFIYYLDEWFVERKGLAYGIFWAGSGVGSSVVPFVMEWSLDKYGFRITLRAWGIFIFICLLALVYFIRPRKPLPNKGVTQHLNISFLRDPLFWSFQIGNIFEGLGYFMVPFWLPSFCKAMNLAPLASVLSVALLNVSSIIGLISTGKLIDVMHVSNVLLLSALAATATVFLLWGFATTSPLVYAFSVMFGITAGGYNSCWTGCAKEVKKAQEEQAVQRKGSLERDQGGEGTVELAVVMGTMAAGRGFGCFASGPISEALLKLPRLHGKGVWGSEYGWLVIFVGLAVLMGRFGTFSRFGARYSEDNGKREGDGEDE